MARRWPIALGDIVRFDGGPLLLVVDLDGPSGFVVGSWPRWSAAGGRWVAAEARLAARTLTVVARCRPRAADALPWPQPG